jgi:hypothetical protein
VVDLPEGVSFETDLPVIADRGAGGAAARGARPAAIAARFAESETVFSPPVVEGFARSLRRIRVFASRPTERLREAAAEALA